MAWRSGVQGNSAQTMCLKLKSQNLRPKGHKLNPPSPTQTRTPNAKWEGQMNYNCYSRNGFNNDGVSLALRTSPSLTATSSENRKPGL